MLSSLLWFTVLCLSVFALTLGVVSVPTDDHVSHSDTLSLNVVGSVQRPPNISQPIQWGPCDPTVVTNTALSCGSLEVPLDYHDHSAGKGRLALVKANATGERLGTVFFNPGGPGGSGLQAVNGSLAILLSFTGGRYDVVSWDPRGVGSLTIPGEVFCFDSVDDYIALFRDTIEITGIEMTGNFTDPADIRALFDQASIMQRKYEETGQRCLQSSSGRFLRYMGTAATARDLVAMADAIEGPGSPINYYGISYGTLLGSWFINMFPERVGRVILDAVLDPVFFATQEVSVEWARNQLTSADDVFKGMITGCALAGPEGCAIASAGQTPADVNDAFQALLKTAHDATKANSSVPLTSGEIRTVLYPEMYIPPDWSNLVNNALPQIRDFVLQEAQNVSREAASDIIPKSLRKRQSANNIQFSTRAIFCGDSLDLQHTTMADVFRALVSASRNVSSMYAAQWPSVFYTCSFWPVRTTERYQGPFNKTLANNILVIGNTFDPVTPFHGAKHVADLLGDQAALVRFNTFGHTTIESAPSTCITSLMQAYMVNGTLPADAITVCEVDESFEVFKGVSIPDILEHFPSFDV